MTPERLARPGVVLGLVGHDIHVVGNRVLAIGLAENGFEPYNIGTNNGVDDFVDAVLETGARAVLVSSINGEGEQSCAGFGNRFRARGLADIPLYIGGNLVIGTQSAAEVERLFITYGFCRVFSRPTSFHPVFEALKREPGVGRPE